MANLGALFVVLVALLYSASAQTYTIDRLYAVCYPYASPVPQFFLFNPVTGSYRVGPTLDSDSALAAGAALSVGLHHGYDNNLYYALSNSWNDTFGGNLFVRRYEKFANSFPTFTEWTDNYYAQENYGGLSQVCGARSNRSK